MTENFYKEGNTSMSENLYKEENPSMSENLYKDMMNQIVPGDELLQNTKDNMVKVIETGTPRYARRKPKLRTLLAAAALCVITAAVAFAATDKLFFGLFTDRAELRGRWDGIENIAPSSALYNLEFTSYDELRDLFPFRLDNEYMDNFTSAGGYFVSSVNGVTERWTGSGERLPGQMMAVSYDDIPFWAWIDSRFIMDDLMFRVSIQVPLDGDDGSLHGFCMELSDSDGNARDGAVKHIYRGGENGIEAQIFTGRGMMDMRFKYNGAYYYLHSGELWGNTGTGADEMLETAKRFIDAFE
jgi:hypothetical protein